MKRRRFLQITAVAACMGCPVRADTWQGQAFGADVSIRVSGALPLAEVLTEIAEIEASFSLHRPSELTLLNERGRGPGSERLRKVLGLSRRVHDATGGAFDPTIQPLWQALAAGADTQAARQLIGLERVALGAEVRLGSGQALSLNGIAQGYAADRIAAILARHGLTQCLIDMGEFRALGGRFRIGLDDPVAGALGAITLGAPGHGAVATSSPAAMTIAGQSHILGPQGQKPLWSSVSVIGDEAALCDAASTAFVLMPAAAIAAARDRLGLGPVIAVDDRGNLSTI